MSEVREAAEEKAKRLGLTLVKPGPFEVFVDLDSTAERIEFERRFDLAKKLWKRSEYRYTESVNGSGGERRHAYVLMPNLQAMTGHERIALQAALGSDPFREMLAIFHGRAGYVHTSVFFEKPEPEPEKER